MYPEYKIFGFTLPSWGTLVAIGVLFLVGVLFYYFKKEKLMDVKIDNLLILTAVSGLVMYLSAMFFDALWHNIKVYKETGEFSWEWWGVTFSGGLVGGLLTYFIGYWFLFKKERYNIFHYLNFIVVGIVIAHAFGRIGCFLAGCCYGKHTDSWLGVNYPIDQIYIGGHWENIYDKVYPTQLFEAGFLFILFIVLFFVIKKNQLRYYLVSYGVFRYILEFFRGDDRGGTSIQFLTPSQLLSVLMIIGGVLLFIFEKKIVYFLKKKYNPELLVENSGDTMTINIGETPNSNEEIIDNVIENKSITEETNEESKNNSSE